MITIQCCTISPQKKKKNDYNTVLSNNTTRMADVNILGPGPVVGGLHNYLVYSCYEIWLSALQLHWWIDSVSLVSKSRNIQSANSDLPPLDFATQMAGDYLTRPQFFLIKHTCMRL